MSLFLYDRESIFFLNLCLPSLDTQGLDAALCPFCSITDAVGKFGWETSHGHISVAGLWPSAQPGHPGPPGPSKGGLFLRGCARQLSRLGLFQEFQLAPRAAAGAPRPTHYFRLSAVGDTGVLCATSSLCSNSAERYSMVSISPLLLLFMSYY